MKLPFSPHLTTEMEINNFSYFEKKKVSFVTVKLDFSCLCTPLFF